MRLHRLALLTSVGLSLCACGRDNASSHKPAAEPSETAPAGRTASATSATRPVILVGVAGDMSRDGVTIPGCPAKPDECRGMLAAGQLQDGVDLVAAPTAPVHIVLAAAKQLRAAGAVPIGLCPAATEPRCAKRLHDIAVHAAAARLEDPPAPMLVLSITDDGGLILGARPIEGCRAADAATCPALRDELSKRVHSAPDAEFDLLIDAGKVTWADYLEVVTAALAAKAKPRLLFELRPAGPVPRPRRAK